MHIQINFGATFACMQQGSYCLFIALSKSSMKLFEFFIATTFVRRVAIMMDKILKGLNNSSVSNMQERTLSNSSFSRGGVTTLL